MTKTHKERKKIQPFIPFFFFLLRLRNRDSTLTCWEPSCKRGQKTRDFNEKWRLDSAPRPQFVKHIDNTTLNISGLLTEQNSFQCLLNQLIERNDKGLATCSKESQNGGRVGLVVRALAFHQCGPGSISALDVIRGLSLLVLYSAMRGFPPGTPVFPSHQKPTLDLI